MTARFQGRLADVIRRPLITEKATRALEINQYTFEVDHRAAKPDIKAAIVENHICGGPRNKLGVTFRFSSRH